MPGTFIFRPLQANLIHDRENVGQMDPFCKIKLGHHSAKTSVAKSEGKHPHWEDVLKLKQKHGETTCRLTMKDYDRLSRNDFIGDVTINLKPVELKGQVREWYLLYDHDRLAGEVFIEISYVPTE